MPNSSREYKKEHKTESALEHIHPAVLLVYYAAMIGGTFLCAHPVYAAISLFCALVQAFCLGGRRAVPVALGLGLPLFVGTAVLNPLLVHQGSTILFYIRYNPVTLEACVYGLVFAGTLWAGVLWFFCCGRLMTSDKFLYLLGRPLPTMALMASMIFRLIPRLRGQMAAIAEGQRGMGRGNNTGGLLQKTRNGLRVLSIAVTWALEDAVITADSMKARGYGTHRRSHFSLFRITAADALFLGVVAILAAVALWGGFTHGQYLFYPVREAVRFDALAVIQYGAFLLLGLCPVAAVLKENVYWKSFV